MNYTVKGKDVLLVGNDFMSSGGEAKVYKKNKTIYKIYHNASDMIPDGKIDELQKIKEKNVLTPQNVIKDSKGVRVGFTMDYIDRVIPLCKLFTNTFINQNNVSNNAIIALVSLMKETIQKIHEAGCIQVDGNELNYLVSEKNFIKCYFIDVNSYQTKSFPATVIMPSIRDWSAKKFNELTDWYSFAIIACQLFVGIHPFKGKHQDFKRHDMEKRMRANISIFNKNTRVPKSVRNFDRIPSNYMDWFIDLFENGKRVLPPEAAGIADATVRFIVVTSTDNFVIEERDTYDDVILNHYTLDAISITRTKQSIYIENDKYNVTNGVSLIHTPKTLTPTFVKVDNGWVVLKSLNPAKKVYPGSEMAGEKIFVIDNTIYVKYKGDLIETRFMETGQAINILLVTKRVWTISENSSQFFNNMIVEDLLGSKHVTIPLPNISNSQLVRTRIPELDDYKVLDAKYEKEVAVLSVFHQKDMEYKLMVLTGIATQKKYMCRFINNHDFNEVNFTTLDNGIVILIYDGQMEIFRNDPTINTVKIIKDKELNSNMKLCKRGISTRFFVDNKLYSMGVRG